MPQMVMPLFPHGVTHINNLLAFFCEEGTVTYFNGTMPAFSRSETDLALFLMAGDPRFVVTIHHGKPYKCCVG